MDYIREQFDIRDCKGKERTRQHRNTCEHLQTLKKYAEKVDVITEFGTGAGNATFALLMGNPKKLTTYDINPTINVKKVQKDVGKYMEFNCIKADTSKIEIENTDLLFIDSLHTYKHLSKELELHSESVNKYMMFHDTVTFGRNDQRSDGPGLMTAIEEFIEKNPRWSIIEHFEYQHGLTVLEKK